MHLAARTIFGGFKLPTVTFRKRRIIGIDLGTHTTDVFIDDSPVDSEPTIIRIRKGTQEILAIGKEAFDSWDRTPEDQESIWPVKAGSIQHNDLVTQYIKMRVDKVSESNNLPYNQHAIILVTVHTNAPESVIRTLAKCTKDALVTRNVYMSDQATLAAIGAGVDIMSENGSMVIDIGGGTTDIAVHACGGRIPKGYRSEPFGGFSLNQNIVKYVLKKHRLQIGEPTAQKIKEQMATALYVNGFRHLIGASSCGLANEFQPDSTIQVKKIEGLENRPKTMTVYGNSKKKDGPTKCELTLEEASGALENTIANIITGVQQVTMEIVPEHCQMIYDNGAFLTGGGGNLFGLDHRFKHDINLTTYVPPNSKTSVIDGVRKVLLTDALFKADSVTRYVGGVQ